MLFKCLPQGTEPQAGRFPGPVHARGKWFTIDIHFPYSQRQGCGHGKIV
jgi:hypothetical protein